MSQSHCPSTDPGRHQGPLKTKLPLEGGRPICDHDATVRDHKVNRSSCQRGAVHAVTLVRPRSRAQETSEREVIALLLVVLPGGATVMEQLSMFGSADDAPAAKPGDDRPRRLRVLITVKAAPNPSERYGETVCVAGFNAAPDSPGWVRLYPINFRELGVDESFKKYDIVEVDAVPARQDLRHESWRPRMNTLRVTDRLENWKARKPWLDPFIEGSMCSLYQNCKHSAAAKSLALVRPRKVIGLKVERHPGWTSDQRRKIDQYITQEQLFQERDRTPLEAPRFQARYHYLCHAEACKGHEQGLLDWEFVAFQRHHLRHLDDEAAIVRLREQFFDMMCAHKRLPAFYVGNQAKRAHVFSVLGVYYPER
ncbi:hypothetical protein ACQPZQ_02400 [Pseudonocardia sp. CA-142604]|uniref:hypothetical protein n=1 Tax=Pseudonocardia sp. CA-142604 TaxID=3240024 RepID=UPI003D8D9267